MSDHANSRRLSRSDPARRHPVRRTAGLVGAVLVVMLLIGCSTADVASRQSSIVARQASVVRAFRADHPCPSTGQTTGACPGWLVDHKYPLCAGGADETSNMMWQDTAQSYVKDRLERELCACKQLKDK